MARPIITLLTDFGTTDSYVGQVKGQLLSRCPDCQLVDITHQVPPQDVRSGARILAEAAMQFPSGTVHLAIVDPGVGTNRSILAAEVAGQFLVLPDNGLISDLLNRAPAARLYWVAAPELWNSPISSTFHGRDIMAPVAAFLASGGALSQVGPELQQCLRLPRLPPVDRQSDGSWLCSIVGLDHFGNLQLTSCPELVEGLAAGRVAEIRRPGVDWQRLAFVTTYGQAAAGQLVLLLDSQGRLELAVVGGSAASQLTAAVGDQVKIRLAALPTTPV